MERCDEFLDGTGVKQVRVVLPRANQFLFTLFHFYIEIEIGRTTEDLKRLEREVRQIRIYQRCFLQIESHFKERHTPQFACRLQLLNELIEGQILVCVSTERMLVNLVQEFAKSLVVGELRAQHKRVRKLPDEVFNLRTVPVGGEKAGDDLRLRSVAIEKHIEDSHQDHEHRSVLLLAQALQPRCQFLVNREVVPCSLEGLVGRAWPVGRQIKRCRRTFEPLPPIVEQCRQCLVLQPLTLPTRVVSVLDGQIRKCGRAPGGPGIIKRHKFAHKNAVRPFVANDVVRREQQDVLFGAEAQ